MLKLGTSLFAVMMAFGAFGCDDGAIDKTDQAIRCERVCKAVEECAGSSFDVSDCRMKCVDESTDDDFQAKAKDCDSCIKSENSCTENLTKCGADCATVVGVSAPAGT